MVKPKSTMLDRIENGMALIGTQHPYSILPCITLKSVCENGMDNAIQEVSAYAVSHGLRIISQDVFASDDVALASIRLNNDSFNDLDWPVMWMQDTTCDTIFVSTQFYTTSCKSPVPITIDRQIVGYVFEDDYAHYCLLRNLGASERTHSRIDQTLETWKKLEDALCQAGMQLTDVVRTWFYIDDILDWYDDFNHIRNSIFADHKMYDGIVPASTGIGIGNIDGLALVAGAFAVRPKNASLTIRSLPSPLQCPALEYGSSFSRGVEVSSPKGRLIMVSGTASILPGGATAHVGETDKQISLTMDVVEAILKSRSMDFRNVTRAIAYFKHFSDQEVLADYMRTIDMPKMPLVCTTADICREGLSFEIELDAYSDDGI